MLNEILANLKSDGLGNFSIVDPATFVTLKRAGGWRTACPGLIVSNPNHGLPELLGASRSLIGAQDFLIE